MIRKIFSHFRHGRAEGAFRRDPLILIRTFAPQLIADEAEGLRLPENSLTACWTSRAEFGSAQLEMKWTTNVACVR